MRTAYVYDQLYLEHDTGQHPENAGRLTAIMQTLEKSGLLNALTQIEARDATQAELEAVHHKAYIEHVRYTADSGGGWLDGDTYVSPSSFVAATRAAGGLIALVDAIIRGEVDNGFALVRPPGHHAVATKGMGFCLFNNVAVAAAYVFASHGLERVLIVDHDVHHGNGTADLFYADAHVLYFSTHQYPHYPGTGSLTETGIGKGEGYTVNVPLPAGVGDHGYRRVFEEILAPIVRRYDPQLILVSVGYDVHWREPLASMRLSVTGYAQLTQILKELALETCGGKIAFTLEGGYDLDALACGVAATLEALSGREITDPLGPAPGSEPDISALLQRIKAIHGIE